MAKFRKKDQKEIDDIEPDLSEFFKAYTIFLIGAIIFSYLYSLLIPYLR